MRGLLNYDIARFESFNKYSFPEISQYEKSVECEKWINFDNSIQDKAKSDGLHFYEHDYKFERIWNNPKKYISVLKRYKYVIQPDFSLYYDFPVALQIYNKYRNHWLYSYYQINGIEMIPNISLSSENNFDWTFIGYPTKSIVAFSDIGAIREKMSREVIVKTYDEMIKRLEPKKIIYFTRGIKKAPSECDIVYMPYIKGGI